MKDLDPMVFVSVFLEMLGGMFWPLVIFIVTIAVALIAVLIRDRTIHSIDLVRAELVGLVGGFVGVSMMLGVTASKPEDVLGGPIDWLLTIGIWIAGAIGATITAYVGFSLLRGARGSRSG